MREKTLNTQRRVIDVQWIPDRRKCEDAPVHAVRELTDSTPNAQRSTSNAQGSGKPRFDLEDRLLEFSARIDRLVDSLPNTRAANHIGGELLQLGSVPYANTVDVNAASP